MTVIDQQAWNDWYDGLLHHAQTCVVVIAPGTVGPEPVLCWFSQPLDAEAKRMAHSKDGSVRCGLAIGVLARFHRECRQFGVKPPAPLI